jgi:hypothetical protein
MLTMLVYGVLIYVAVVMLWGLLSNPAGHTPRLLTPEERRIQRIAWKFYGILAAVVIAVSLLTGCTTMASIGAGGTVVDPTPEEQAFIDDFRARVSAVGVAAKLPWCRAADGSGRLFSRRDCAPRVILLDGFTSSAMAPGVVATFNGARFHIRRIVIREAMKGTPPALSILAHETAHWVNHDYHRLTVKRVTPEQAELEANALAPWVLVQGWAMSREDAIRAVWGGLIAEARRGRGAAGSHLSACAELRDFERRLGLVGHGVDGCAS